MPSRANTSAHDAAFERLQRAVKRLPVRDAADAFLASLSTGDEAWRAPLEAVVMARHLRRHEYRPGPDLGACEVCGFCDHEEAFGVSPGRLASFIEELGTARPRPTPNDVSVFEAVLATVREQQRLSIDGRVRRADLVKALTGVVKGNKNSRMGLLDTLGRCSVLSTKAAPGFLREFTPYSLREKAAGNNDFEWPFAQWTAADGFDEAAVLELFGHAGVTVPGAARAKAGFDEKKERATMLRLSEKLRGKAVVTQVVFAPGGLWIARLADGHYALLLKLARKWRWIRGTREDVIASVPEARFAEAVAALGPGPAS